MEYFITLIFLGILGYLGYIFYKKAYIGFALYFVKMRPDKVTKAINQTSSIGERGGKPTILVLGSDIRVAGGDFSLVEPADVAFRVTQRIGNEAQNGGERTRFASSFNSYIQHITGYETNVQAFRDLFTSEVKFLRYDLKRPILVKKTWKDRDGNPVEWWEMEFRKEDFTTQIRHNREAFDFVVPPIETGKTMKTVDATGKETDVPQRIPVSIKCQVFLRVDDPMKAIYKTGKNYLGFVLNILISEMRDVIQGMGYDDLLKQTARRDVMEKVLRGAGDKDGNVTTEGIAGKLLREIGIEILDVQIEDIFIMDDDIRKSVQQQGKELVEGQAKITKAHFDLEESRLIRQRDEQLAQGKAAYGKQRLEGLAEGAKAIQGVMRNHELTRDVVVADRYSEGVEKAKSGTIFVNAGGLRNGAPMPTVDFSPDSEDGVTATPAGTETPPKAKGGGKK